MKLFNFAASVYLAWTAYCLTLWAVSGGAVSFPIWTFMAAVWLIVAARMAAGETCPKSVDMFSYLTLPTIDEDRLEKAQAEIKELHLYIRSLERDNRTHIAKIRAAEALLRSIRAQNQTLVEQLASGAKYGTSPMLQIIADPSQIEALKEIWRKKEEPAITSLTKPRSSNYEIGLDGIKRPRHA